MNWLWVILVAAVIGGIIGYLCSGRKEDVAMGAIGAGVGCGYIILKILLALIGLYLLFLLGSWLFS